MSKSFVKRLLSSVLLFAALLCLVPGLPTAAEAKKVKVEVEVDDDDSTPKKKVAPAKATFPVRFVNKRREKVYVSLLYYDKNSKNWRCRGWWSVQPQKKRSIKLTHVEGKPIYYYVEDSRGRALSRSGTPKGVNWNISKKVFSYLQGSKAKLNKPYKAHFVRCSTDDGWFSLTIN